MAIEVDLRRSFISNKKKKSVYIGYWVIYMVEALSFSIMEYLDRGAINNYITFIIIFTFLPNLNNYNPKRRKIKEFL